MPSEVEQRLREIKERASRATPEPWEAYGVGGIHMDGTSDGYSLMTARGRRLHSPYMTQADADFAAHAREDVPWLLSLLREREEEIRRLRTLLERARIGAWHEACGGREDPDPTWHCCDWRELAEEIDAALRQVAERAGLRSTATVHAHLQRLLQAGVIRRASRTVGYTTRGQAS